MGQSIVRQDLKILVRIFLHSVVDLLVAKYIVYVCTYTAMVLLREISGRICFVFESISLGKYWHSLVHLFFSLNSSAVYMRVSIALSVLCWHWSIGSCRSAWILIDTHLYRYDCLVCFKRYVQIACQKESDEIVNNKNAYILFAINGRACGGVQLDDDRVPFLVVEISSSSNSLKYLQTPEKQLEAFCSTRSKLRWWLVSSFMIFFCLSDFNDNCHLLPSHVRAFCLLIKGCMTTYHTGRSNIICNIWNRGANVNLHCIACKCFVCVLVLPMLFVLLLLFQNKKPLWVS